MKYSIPLPEEITEVDMEFPFTSDTSISPGDYLKVRIEEGEVSEKFWIMIKIYSNDYLVLEGKLIDMIETEDELLIEIISSRSNLQRTWCLTKKYSKIEYSIT